MIVHPRNAPGQRVVTQNDHAALSAEILSLWRADGLPEHPRRRDLLHAVREHDNGWLEADSAPRRRDDGTIHDFLSVPGDWRREIWQRGVERHASSKPYVALLILQHALELHRRMENKASWTELLGAWRQSRDELREEAGLEPDELASDYRWLNLCDSLSLAVCAGWRETQEMHGRRFRVTIGEERIELFIDPFPLAGATTLRLACRSLEQPRFASDTELGVALATARWQRLAVRLAPWDDPRER